MKNEIIKIISLITIACTIISTTGCALKANASDLMEGITAKEVDSIKNLSERTEMTDFAVNIFKQIAQDGKNTLISPLSIISALAMTMNGADGETLNQMESLFGLTKDELNSYIYTYLTKLAQGDKYKLSLANSIWFRNDFNAEKHFLQTNADYYSADVYKTEFNNLASKNINSWVKSATDGMIDNIISDLNEDAVMYLINALAFDAEWEAIYSETQIRKADFTAENSAKQNVDFMYGTDELYLDSYNASGFIKYYADRKYAFAALLPDEEIDINDYISTLTGEKISKIINNAENVTVNTAIPKFKTEYFAELSDTLQDLGVTNAFDVNIADFSKLGTSESGNIFISNVFHKAFISIDESGTKAGAATNEEYVALGIPTEYKTVYLNRPFVYMIIDCETNTPFFIGCMKDILGTDEKESTQNDVEFSAEYIRTDKFTENTKYPYIDVIRTKSELDKYVDSHNKYNDEYFKKNILLIAVYEEPSGSIRHTVKKVTTNEKGEAYVDIERITPQEVTDDMALWHILIEPKSKNNITVARLNYENLRIENCYKYANMSLEKFAGWNYEK